MVAGSSGPTHALETAMKCGACVTEEGERGMASAARVGLHAILSAGLDSQQRAVLPVSVRLGLPGMPKNSAPNSAASLAHLRAKREGDSLEWMCAR
jgi:hypothetical protein